jgi:branched-chain amino acid aminotransferase
MSPYYSFVNDQFVPANNARLSITDMAIQRGYGIFDFFKFINHRLIFIDDHLERLEKSAEAMRLILPYDREQIISILHELISRNDAANGGIRVGVTAGYAPDGYSIVAPNFIITQQPLQLSPTLAEPIALMTHIHQRQLPHVKTIDYLMAVWLQPVIRQSGAAEVLYRNPDSITECPRANFFIVNQDNIIVTPAKHILAGVTRKHIIHIAEKEFTVEQRDITPEEVYTAKEAFISSSTINIKPVGKVDGHLVNNGTAGNVTAYLFNKLLKEINY